MYLYFVVGSIGSTWTVVVESSLSLAYTGSCGTMVR